MPNPSGAILVIGDEILSGRTQDTNSHYLATELTKNGVDLREVRVVADVAADIKDALLALSSRYDYVFTSGGIGPTHDDITADAVGAALGRNVSVRDDARALLQAHYDRQGIELNEARLRMARIPAGACLIENPISAAPGFSIGNVYVMAGVPTVFRAMVASILPSLTGGTPLTSKSVRINRGEGDIAGPLAELAQDFQDLSFGSYPSLLNGTYGASIVIRGTDTARIDEAMTRLVDCFEGHLE